MSGLFNSFRLPSVVKRQKKSHGLPSFDWNLLKNQRELGHGSFGIVFSADYGVDARKVVVKNSRENLWKINGDS
jgi:hypothetical protein